MIATIGELRTTLDAGRILLLDGATGTELERRGVACPAPLWSAAALRTHPEVVEQIHREYVAAGADIVVANTFRANPRTLRRAGAPADGPELCRRALDLARRAADDDDRRVWVAASVGPAADCYSPQDVPDEATLGAEHAELARWLADAGADWLWIETINTVREARAAAAAASAASLPFAISFVTRESGALLNGEPLRAAIEAVTPFRPLALGVNCIPPRGIDRVLPQFAEAASGCTATAGAACAAAAYAHIHNARPLPGWSYAQGLAPTEYADVAQGWAAAGAGIVGGCCGTTPAHIAAVRAILARDSGGAPRAD
ncbi:MAG: homocysteine S-methyltransferase family protein [Phycisphaerae bacterium]